MAAEINAKKNLSAKHFCFFGCLLPQNPSNPISQLSWFFQTIWNKVRKSNKGAQRNYFCLKWFSKKLHKNFFKKTSSRFWRPGIQPKTWNSDLNFFAHALLHINSIWYKSSSGHLIGTSSKCHKFWGQNF